MQPFGQTRLTKWLSVRLRTTWLWVRDQLQSLRTISDLEIVLGWWKRNQH